LKQRPLLVSFLWHFHQPFYKDLVANEYLMPWVRLHALKDYYDMGAILESVPGAKATFNFVPSLLAQLMDYTSGEANDLYLRLSEKPAEELTTDERMFILANFFAVSRKIISRFPRYEELLARREPVLRSAEELMFFCDADFRDLQVLFNLAWSGNSLRREDAVVRRLTAKGRNFSEEDKKALLAAQRAFLSKVIPLYRRLAEAGVVELSSTPFYHPILPLLLDVNAARESMPNVNLPQQWEGSPQDAERQVQAGRDFFRAAFGFAPVGMWPAEGAVSQQTCPIYARHGINWIATDEAILFRSLGRWPQDLADRCRLGVYLPHSLGVREGSLAIYFRDHRLSDAIGFVYSSWDTAAAVDDFLSRLRKIWEAANAGDNPLFERFPPVVSIILDGENAWEFYPDNGEPFLRALYWEIVKAEWLEMTTFGEYLSRYGAGCALQRLVPGSWIRGDFGVWIGHPEDNKAWDWVASARRALVEHPPDDPQRLKLAWESLYAAEGSDWNWWYGDDHHCANIEEFDKLFRRHIANVYTLAGQEVPLALDVPIKRTRPVRLLRQPTQFLSPTLDGRDTSYFEWLGAGVFDQDSVARGAMHRVADNARRLYFGFDLERLFIRVDFNRRAQEVLPANGQTEAIVEFSSPRQVRVRVIRNGQDAGHCAPSLVVMSQDGGKWHLRGTLDTVAIDQVLELAIPFELLGAKPEDRVWFRVKLVKGENVLESIPEDSVVELKAPGPEFEEEEWYV